MGDRAYAQVVCSAKDVTAFEELGFGEEEYWKSLPEGVAFLVRPRSQLRQLLSSAGAG